MTSGDTQITKAVADLKLVGGHPVMDFLNSVESRRRPGPEVYLHDFSALLDLCVRLELLKPGAARTLKNGVPAAAGRRVLADAIELREALYRLFRAGVEDKAAGDGDVAVLNRALARTADLHRFHRHGAHLDREWKIDVRRPEVVLGMLAEAAAELLQSEQLKRVKMCPPPDGCTWLFLDTSRNGSRTWCSMEDCGNAAKVRRFRRRARAS